MNSTIPTLEAASTKLQSLMNSCSGRAPWPIALPVPACPASACTGTACPAGRSSSNRLRFRPLAAFVMAAALLLDLSASAGTVVWNYGGVDRNWSTAGNWTGGVPAGTNAVLFNNTDAQTDTNTVNTVDASTAVSSLSYTNWSAGSYSSYQNTTVASGRTLSITNGLVAGAGTDAGATADLYTVATLTGGAGAKVAVTGGNVQVGHQINTSSATYYVRPLLDMRGLESFSYTNGAGNFSIAGAGQRRAGGEVYLASTNSITASAISLGIGAVGFGSNPGKLHLGSSNVLFADTITVGKIGGAAGTVIDFQTGFLNPTVKIRARDGVSGVANWYLGWETSGNQSSSSAYGTCDFSVGVLDAAVTNLYVGWFSGGTSSSGKVGNGTFIMGASPNNSLVVQNLIVAEVDVNFATGTTGSTGLFAASGGTVTAGAVSLAPLAQSGVLTATATLALTNATMQVSGNITSGGSGGGTSTITISNATLTVAGRMGVPTPTANNVGTLNLNAATVGLTLVAPGDYTKAAASVGTLNVDGAAGSTLLRINNAGPAPGQYPLIGYTSLGGAAGFGGLSVQAPAGYTATLVNNTATSPSTIDVILNASQLTWNGVPNGNWDIGATGNWKSSATYNEAAGVGPLVLFDDTASGTTTVNLTTTLKPQGTTVNNTNKDYTFGGSGKLSGAGGLNKQGPGTLTLVQTGVNDYTGTTAVGAGGKLAVGNGGTSGMVGPGPLAVDGTVEFNRSDNVNLTNSISGLGGLSKLGANTLTLAGATIYGGPTTIAGGTLGLNPAGTDTLPGNITGNGGLAINGAGTVVLSGAANNYSGGTLISAGTLQIGDGVNAGSLPGNVTNQGSLVFSSPAYTAANNISGSGSVMSIGSVGSLTLAGANTYTGATTIRNGGALYLGSAASFPPQSLLALGETGGISIGSADFTGYNVVTAGLTVGGNQASPNTLTLGSGQSLTINGNVSIGNTGGGGARANLTVNGSGAALTINTNGGLIQLGLSTAGAGTTPNNVDFNLTGLDTFVASLGAAGLLSIGDVNLNQQNGPGTVVLRLGATNTISAGTIAVGNGGKGSLRQLHLGSGTNSLNADLVKVGLGDSGGRDSGALVFENSSGSVRLCGFGGGTSRANLSILVGATAATTGSTNTFDVAGHYADLLIGSLVMGDQAARVGAWDNYFGFDQGVLDANAVSLSKACRSGTSGSSVMHLGGGTVNLGSLALASSSAAATLDISGGQVTVNSDITKTGTGVGTIQVANAALLVKGRIATQASPMDVLSLDGATLSIGRSVGYGNPTAALVDAASLSLSGTCTVALTGTNYAVGQFPLIRYVGTIGGSGFASITTFTPPPGVTATLVDNSGNQTIDVNITAAPPAQRASIGLAVAGDSLGLLWADLGMTLQTNAVSVSSPADWFAYPGSTSVTNVTLPINPGSTNVFFRLLYP